jgi:hypothetical protein
MHLVSPYSPRQALLPTLAGVLLLSASVFAQQPGHDPQEIPPTPGVTPIETPSSRATAARPARQTPGVTRTPTARHSAAAGLHRRGTRRHDAAVAGGHEPGGTAPPNGRAASTRSSHDPLQPRDVATWIVFGVLIVALGFVTIRMLRFPRAHPGTLEPIDVDDLL